jgi:hypothetical protein
MSCECHDVSNVWLLLVQIIVGGDARPFLTGMGVVCDTTLHRGQVTSHLSFWWGLFHTHGISCLAYTAY